MGLQIVDPAWLIQQNVPTLVGIFQSSNQENQKTYFAQAKSELSVVNRLKFGKIIHHS